MPSERKSIWMLHVFHMINRAKSKRQDASLNEARSIDKQSRVRPQKQSQATLKHVATLDG